MSTEHHPQTPEALLQHVPLFARLDHRERKKLAAVCLPKTFPVDTHIVEEGRPGLGLFIITAGKAEVYRGTGDDRQLLNTVETGSILGEMSLIDNQPRSASVVTVEPTECLLITRDSFHTLVQKQPQTAWCIAQVLAERFRRLDGKLLELMDTHAQPETTPADKTEAIPGESAKEEKKRLQAPDTEHLLDALRAEYALLLAGTEGLSRSADIMETFLRSLAREMELTDSRRLEPLLKAVPKAMKSALADALVEGERLPERMLSTFRREFRR
jgi:CRP/FNR family cyclic AMP-dependent transcriptional regulator